MNLIVFFNAKRNVQLKTLGKNYQSFGVGFGGISAQYGLWLDIWESQTQFSL